MADPSAKQVFINCPFDEGYHHLFRAIVFTIVSAGFTPRCALEFDDANTLRLNGIMDIMRECDYGIHDISRVELDAVNGLPRFNMPFELGYFSEPGTSVTGIRRKSSVWLWILSVIAFRNFCLTWLDAIS
jgi:hypothetical protein